MLKIHEWGKQICGCLYFAKSGEVNIRVVKKKSGFVFSNTLWGAGLLALALLNWLYVYTTSLRVHPRAFSHIKNVNQLVTEGRYAASRHPLYVADIILGWCIFLWQPSYQVLAIMLWLTLVLIFWANIEERQLAEKFMQDYTAYKRRVPMFIPSFKKRLL